MFNQKDRQDNPTEAQERLLRAINVIEEESLVKPCLEQLHDAHDSGWYAPIANNAQNRAYAHRSITVAVMIVQEALRFSQNTQEKDQLQQALETLVNIEQTDSNTAVSQTTLNQAIKTRGYTIPPYSDHVKLALNSAQQIAQQLYQTPDLDLSTQDFLQHSLVNLYKEKKLLPQEDADKNIQKIIENHQQQQNDLTNEYYDRLQRTFELSTNHPKWMLFMHSLPFVGRLYFWQQDLDADLYHIISSLYSISGYRDDTSAALKKLYTHFFSNESPYQSKAERLAALHGFLADKNGLFFKMEEEGSDFFKRSAKDAGTFLRSFKLAINRIARKAGLQRHINSKKRIYYDEHGEAQKVQVYGHAIDQDRSLKHYGHARWKLWVVIGAIFSAGIVGPGQGIIAANGFYQSAGVIGTMVNGLPVIGQALSHFFMYLTLHPVALFAVVFIVFLSSTYTNFYLFSGDALDVSLKVMRGELFKGFSGKQKALGYFSMIFALAMGITIGGLTLFSMLNLALPLAAATAIPLGVLQAVSVGVSLFTVASVSLTMVAALVSKIRNEIHWGAARYLLNLALPFVHLFKLNKTNSDKLQRDFNQAVQWDQSIKTSQEKWSSLTKNDRKKLLRTVLANLIAEREGKAKIELGLTVGNAPKLQGLDGFVNAASDLSTDDFFVDDLPRKLESEQAALNILFNIPDTEGKATGQATAKSWALLRERLIKGPILSKTQRQQYQWAKKYSNIDLSLRLMLGLYQLFSVALFGVGLIIAGFACLAMIIAWRQATVSALVYFNMAKNIANNIAFVVVYVFTGPVVAMFFGASIIKLFSEMVGGTLTKGFGYHNSAHDQELRSKYEALTNCHDRGKFFYYLAHTISYAVVSLFVAAMLINATGNALVSLLTGQQFQHNLWSLHVHANLLEAQFAAFLTAWFASTSVNFFPIRASLAKATPHLTMKITSWLKIGAQGLQEGHGVDGDLDDDELNTEELGLQENDGNGIVKNKHAIELQQTGESHPERSSTTTVPEGSSTTTVPEGSSTTTVPEGSSTTTVIARNEVTKQSTSELPEHAKLQTAYLVQQAAVKATVLNTWVLCTAAAYAKQQQEPLPTSCTNAARSDSASEFDAAQAVVQS